MLATLASIETTLALQTGEALLTTLWNGIGILVIAAAMGVIIFKFFLGQSKNIGGGVIAMVGVAVLAFFLRYPTKLMALGEAIAKFLTLT